MGECTVWVLGSKSVHERQGLGHVNHPDGTPSICKGGLDLAEATEIPRAGNMQNGSNYKAFMKNPFTPSSM